MVITQPIIQTARDFAKDKIVLRNSMTAVVLSEKYTVNIVSALYDECGIEKSTALSIDKRTDEIKVTKKFLSMSDQSIFFWLVWAVFWLEDDNRNKIATDEKAFRVMMAAFDSPYSDFVWEFGSMVNDDEDRRITPLLKILELRDKAIQKQTA